MPRTAQLGMLCAMVASLLLSTSLSVSQDAKPVATPSPPAPIPVQITTAQKVFVSNAGVDGLALSAFQRLGDANRPYNRFYAELKNLERYELVSAPADADLVFEIRFAAPLSDCEKVTTYEPQYVLTIVDAKTHFILWTLAEPVEGAFRKATAVRNLDRALVVLVGDLKALSAPRAGADTGKP